ncbi:hypothetical protein X564_18215 [Pseudoalteromonas agarivorans]|nr:hypothetical protein X564_18215 [Pseudoalteromonas agarivorans]
MFGIYAALSPIHVEQPHFIGSALPKKPNILLQIQPSKINTP